MKDAAQDQQADGGPHGMPDEFTLARAVLAATLGVAGVVGIGQGRYAVARTVGLGGRTVEGVLLAPSTAGLSVEVHIVADWVPLPALAAAVRSAVIAALRSLGTAIAGVDVWVDELRGGPPEEDFA